MRLSIIRKQKFGLQSQEYYSWQVPHAGIYNSDDVAVVYNNDT